jgi:uncharacterized protein YacL
MIEKVLRILITVLSGIGGLLTADRVLFSLPQGLLPDFALIGIFGVTVGTVFFYMVGGLAGSLIGYVFSPWLTRFVRRYSIWMEGKLLKMPLHDVLAGLLGLGIGLIIANLLGAAFIPVPLVGSYIPVFLSVILGFTGINVAIRKREELAALPLPAFLGGGKERGGKEKVPTQPGHFKILDTSVIIDGRIADICKSGFIEGTLLIPGFVLEELQHIADSSDLLKRNRGRRGLDILNRIQKEMGVFVQIDNRNFEDVAEVDAKLVRLGQLIKGKILTNDYNLNKVAELQGVTVMNINELANAVKPVVLPGEEMVVHVVKDGKETGQGVAYLDDGTMIVVDNGRKHLGDTIEVLVTSVLQTAAGRMIFAKLK